MANTIDSRKPEPAKPPGGFPIMELVIAGVLLLIIGVAAFVYLNRGKPQEKEIGKQDPPSTPTKKGETPLVGSASPVDPPMRSPVNTNRDPALSLPITPLPSVKVVEAIWGFQDKRVDVTQQVRAYLAKDPYAPIQGDDLLMGDPAFGFHKTLQLQVEIEGLPVTLSVMKEQVTTVPAFGEDGIPWTGAAKELRILAARYGRGLRWYDVTQLVAQRAIHPGEVCFWGGLAWTDPWPNEINRCVVWFEYDGKRFVKMFYTREMKPLLPSVAPLPPKRTFQADLKTVPWRSGQSATILGPSEGSFAVISEITGSFQGYGEEVKLSIGPDQSWQLSGVAQQPLAAHAMLITSPLRDKFEEKLEEYHWDHNSKSPVKMIHSKDGFCVLSSVSGKFAALQDSAYLEINPKDGFWYLKGQSSSGAASCSALAYRLKPNSGVRLRISEYVEINNGFLGSKLIHQDQGFCYLSGIAGAMRGVNEQARVFVRPDGFWEFKPLRVYARAVVVRVE